MTDLIQLQESIWARHSYLILALPLLSFIINSLLFSKKKKISAAISTVLSGASFAYVLGLVIPWFKIVLKAGSAPAQILWNWNWFPMTENFGVKLGLLLDPISAMMLVVITAIALLVHVYSVGYM